MNEQFWNGVAARDEVRWQALERGEAQPPIGEGDLIRWRHSFRQCGYVIARGVIVMGKLQLPAYKVWNPLFASEDYIPADDAILWGWGEAV